MQYSQSDLMRFVAASRSAGQQAARSPRHVSSPPYPTTIQMPASKSPHQLFALQVSEQATLIDQTPAWGSLSPQNSDVSHPSSEPGDVTDLNQSTDLPQAYKRSFDVDNIKATALLLEESNADMPTMKLSISTGSMTRTRSRSALSGHGFSDDDLASFAQRVADLADEVSNGNTRNIVSEAEDHDLGQMRRLGLRSSQTAGTLATIVETLDGTSADSGGTDPSSGSGSGSVSLLGDAVNH